MSRSIIAALMLTGCIDATYEFNVADNCTDADVAAVSDWVDASTDTHGVRRKYDVYCGQSECSWATVVIETEGLICIVETHSRINWEGIGETPGDNHDGE